MNQKKKRSRLYQRDEDPVGGHASPKGAPDRGTDTRGRAMRVVRRHTLYGSGTGLIPIPGADIAGLSGVQFRMIAGIARIYGVPVHRERLRAVVSSLLTGLLSASLIYGPVSHMLGLATGIGWGLRSAVAVTVSAAATRALGIVFIRHFESGGSLLDFNVEEKRDELNRTFENEIKDGDKGTKDEEIGA
jgi:uncharacterized protein (DUF697 family)